MNSSEDQIIKIIKMTAENIILSYHKLWLIELEYTPGYNDMGKIVVNLACYFLSHLLVVPFSRWEEVVVKEGK